MRGNLYRFLERKKNAVINLMTHNLIFIIFMKAFFKDRSEWLYPGEFVHFLVYKEHMESSEVANKLASRLR